MVEVILWFFQMIGDGFTAVWNIVLIPGTGFKLGTVILIGAILSAVALFFEISGGFKLGKGSDKEE